MDTPSHGGVLPQLKLDELLAELQTRLQAVLDTRDRVRGLPEAVVAISSGLELETTLRRIVEAPVDLVDSKYGVIGVIGEGNAQVRRLSAANLARVYGVPYARLQLIGH